MIFPIGDEQIQGGHKPIFSYLFIFINVLVYLWQSTDPAGYLYVFQYGSIPFNIVQGLDIHTLLTSMFMHGGPKHLIGNMIFLWVFADNIESVIGSPKFILFYLLTGIAAAYTHILINPDSVIPCVGASGAIAGTMGAYLVMFPKSRIKLLFFIKIFRVPAFLFLLLWFGRETFSGIGTLQIYSPGDGTDGGGVAYWAHIGGFVLGALLALLFRKDAKKYALVHEHAQLKAAWQRFTS